MPFKWQCDVWDFLKKHFITLTTNLTDLCIQYNCSKVVLQFTAMVQKTLKSLVKKFPTKLKSISEYYLNLSIRLSSLSLLSFFLFLHSPKVSKMKSFLGKAKTCGNSQIPERNHPNAKNIFTNENFLSINAAPRESTLSLSFHG